MVEELRKLNIVFETNGEQQIKEDKASCKTFKEKSCYFTLYFTFREADFKVHFFIVQVPGTQSDLGSYNWKFKGNIMAFQIFFDVFLQSHLAPCRNIIGAVGIAVDFNILAQLEHKHNILMHQTHADQLTWYASFLKIDSRNETVLYLRQAMASSLAHIDLISSTLSRPMLFNRDMVGEAAAAAAKAKIAHTLKKAIVLEEEQLVTDG